MSSTFTRLGAFARLRRIVRWSIPFRRQSWYSGPYPTWEDAQDASAGYGDEAILARVIAAARDVRAGRALWDRDGSTFTKPSLNQPLVRALRRIGDVEGGRLDLVDFGGGFGSTWWQHKEVLGDVARWRVVEQPSFVATGEEFATDVLTFHVSLAEAQHASASPTVLLSGVLQYLEKPLELLASLSGLGFSHVVLDRTPFVTANSDEIVVQHTPPALGGGSYPSWLFTRTSILTAIGSPFELLDEWRGTDDLDPRVEFRGLYARRRP
jgi:putative methyltransferase (TIGR04325 family)